MTIEKSIQKAAQYLPKTWPLQNFIASNPLWDKVDIPLYDLTQELNQTIPIRSSLPIKQYYYYLDDCNIDRVSIKRAAQNWLERIKVQPNNIDYTLDEIICDFLTKPSYADQIRDIDALTNHENAEDIDETYDKDVTHEIIKWCNAFFDFGQATWPAPTKSNNLFHAWHELIRHESREWLKTVNKAPNNPLDVIKHCQIKLAIENEKLTAYFKRILWMTPGWASFIKWLEANPNNQYTDKKASITDLIAMYMLYEVHNNDCVLHRQSQMDAHKTVDSNKNTQIKALFKTYFHNDIDEDIYDQYLDSLTDIYHRIDMFSVKWIWQTALEYKYQSNLVTLIESNLNHTTPHEKSDAQVIFCIDTRSEGLRRHLEYHGNYETFGYAGFFGFPFKLTDSSGKVKAALHPPLIDPNTKIELNYIQQPDQLTEQVHQYLTSINQTKRNGLAAYGLFENIGLWLSLKLVYKTLFIKDKQQKVLPYPDDSYSHVLDSMTVSAASDAAYNFLASIGLTDNFADVVLICAHGAQTENNPYQSSFDCGACGGNAGTPNAIVACEALNHPEVRKLLQTKGIRIPEQTVFIPGLHNTTTDVVSIYTNDSVPEHIQNNIKQLNIDLEHAGNNLRRERCNELPGDTNVLRRSASWSELIPELGLANNAAMIVAPRSITKGLNLQRRTFLHSYEPELDNDGTLLESILTAPVIVAHWINSQYNFSATDPQLYGAGNKAIHNLVGKLGVMEGNSSDLKIGLPIQSVKFQGALLHQPMKLFVVIYANPEIVDEIIDAHPTLKYLFTGQWAYLRVIEPKTETCEA